MKSIFLLVCSVSLLIFPFVDAFSQTNGDLPEVKIINVQRAPLETSDLVVLDLTVTNEGQKPIIVSSSSIVLFDSKERFFEHVSSFDLSNQDEASYWDVSCETFLYDEIQPGLTKKINDLCFQIPKENLEYRLVIAESNYEHCGSDNPYLKNQCIALSIGKIEMTAQEAEKITSSDDGGGCLIATAAYGTELAPEVQNLREIRNKMYETETGGKIMHSVNDFYYSFSPVVADWERENVVFKEATRLFITPSMMSFTILDHKGIDSEDKLIGYVISVVALNVGMYFVAPVVVISKVRSRLLKSI